MFVLDDVAVMVAWYVVGGLAGPPAASAMATMATELIIGPPPPVVAEAPAETLDWLTGVDLPPPPAGVD